MLADNFWTRLTLFAAEEAKKADEAAPGSTSNTLMFFLMIFAGIWLFYYLLLGRPQRAEQARRAAMLRAVKPNDRVVTAGGIHGVVTNVHVEADVVTIRVDESNNTKLRVSLGAIARVIAEETSSKEPESKT